MLIAPQPRSEFDAPSAARHQRGVSLPVLSRHARPRWRSCIHSASRWRLARLQFSRPLTPLCQHMLALRPSQSNIVVCNEVCNGEFV